MPCYSNLVVYDQTKRLGRLETIVPELAQKWSWQGNYRNLVFFLSAPTASRTIRYVKNLIPDQVTYNCCRLQEVWLDE